MKFLKFLIISTVFLMKLISDVMSKNLHPEQSTRNYRHLHTDLSYNPLPSSYSTGDRHNFAQHAQAKHRVYNSKLANHHTYADTTRSLGRLH